MFASRLAHGETISEIATGTKRAHKTALYHRWMVWRHLHPKIGMRLRKLSIDNKHARVREANRERRERMLTPSVAAPPPDDMWAIIEAVVPRALFSELRREVCQRLALDVLERRCECTVAGLSNALQRHRRDFYKEYASRWGDLSLDEQLFDGSPETRGDHLIRGL